MKFNPGLSPGQEGLVSRQLNKRIGRDGVLRVLFQGTNSQAADREAAVERFVELMREAVKKAPARKKTGVGKAVKHDGSGQKGSETYGKMRERKRSQWVIRRQRGIPDRPGYYCSERSVREVERLFRLLPKR